MDTVVQECILAGNKNPCTSGPMQFKPMVFKGILYIYSFVPDFLDFFNNKKKIVNVILSTSSVFFFNVQKVNCSLRI